MKNITPFVLAAAVGLSSATSVRAAETSEKYTYVIVHGATAGGWEWKRTAKFLTDDGHTAYRVTLTGLGERKHLSSSEINLETHVNDVVNLILFEDLHDVVLTGHSYGGMVITGVMDRVPDRIRHVVFLDAAVPDDGMSLYDLFGGPRSAGPCQCSWTASCRFPGLNPTPPPHNVAQSIKCFSQPVSYKNPLVAARHLRRLCTEGQVSRGARHDGQELAARSGPRLDHSHFPRRPRRPAGGSARRRDVDGRGRSAT